MSSETITRNDLTAILNEVLPPLPTVDMFFPVGSYYETSDASFDPNVSWGGTWVLITNAVQGTTGAYNRVSVRNTAVQKTTSTLDLGEFTFYSKTGRVFIDGTEIASSTTNLKSEQRGIVNFCTNITPIEAHTISYKIITQNTSTTATVPAYQTNTLMCMDVPSTTSNVNRWHRTA